MGISRITINNAEMRGVLGYPVLVFAKHLGQRFQPRGDEAKAVQRKKFIMTKYR